jgi:hypothetical protein
MKGGDTVEYNWLKGRNTIESNDLELEYNYMYLRLGTLQRAYE